MIDQFGREIKVPEKPGLRQVTVASLRDRWSTYPSSGLTPEKLAAILKEADAGDVYRQAELFEEMEEKDPHIASVLQTRRLAVTGLEYDVAPWSEAREDKRVADFCRDALFNLDGFEDAIFDLLDAIGKGFSLCEIIWGVDAGKALINGLHWIHPKRAVFYERGAAEPWTKSLEVPRVTTEAEPVNGEGLPPFKMAYHRYKARSGYDTRAGVLRTCAWMFLFKNYAVKDWVAFAEVFGQPLRLGKYDPGASQGDKEALIDAIRSLGTDAAGIISKSTEIEFVEAIRGRFPGNLYQELAEFCDRQVSKAVLGQTATTDGAPGKLGGGKAQDRVRHDLLKADAEALSKTIRFQLIRPLVGFNFGWDVPLPWFKMVHDRPEDLVNLVGVYGSLSKIGFPLTVEHVSERFKVPLPNPGDRLIVRPEESTPQMEPVSAKILSHEMGKMRVVMSPRPIPESVFGRGLSGRELICRSGYDEGGATRKRSLKAMIRGRRGKAYGSKAKRRRR